MFRRGAFKQRVPWLIALSLAACGGDKVEPDPDAGPAVEPDFPADYASSYTEVRNCRQSGDHDLNFIRVLADSAATAPYQMRQESFPVGSVVLKEEYEFGDADCSGGIKQWTVMKRVDTATSSDTLGWGWQKVDADRRVVTVDEPRCIGCHTVCGTEEEGGYEATCAHP